MPYKGITSTGAKAASPTGDSGEQSVQRFRPWSQHQVHRLTWANSKTFPLPMPTCKLGMQVSRPTLWGAWVENWGTGSSLGPCLSVRGCPWHRSVNPSFPPPISLSLSCSPPPQGLLWGLPFPFATGWRGHLSLVVASLPYSLVRGPLNADAEAGFLRVAAVPAMHTGPPRLSVILSWPQLQS